MYIFSNFPIGKSKVMRANLLLFKTVIAGDSWGQVAVPVIEYSPTTAIIFCGSLMTLVFGVLNMIVAAPRQKHNKNTRHGWHPLVWANHNGDWSIKNLHFANELLIVMWLSEKWGVVRVSYASIYGNLPQANWWWNIWIWRGTPFSDKFIPPLWSSLGHFCDRSESPDDNVAIRVEGCLNPSILFGVSWAKFS